MATVPLKVQAQAVLDACETLYDLEARQQPPTPVERAKLAAFPGFGCVALDLFPQAVTGQYKDAAWEAMGTQIQQLLTPEDYASAARSTFTAFYTPRLIMRALFLGLKHCGVPDDATVLEPGCGIGRFFAVAPTSMQFVGIEQETLSGRICRLLYPQHDIRIAPIERTSLDPESVDAVVGNVPFFEGKTAYWGRKLSLHELCVAKSIDALRPGGILALVVTHYLLDRQQHAFRDALAQRVTFLGAIRLPSDAFAAEGTRVVADLLFLQKGVQERDGATWRWSAKGVVDDANVTLNCFFHEHREMILGQLTQQDRLYGSKDGYSVTSTGVIANQLAQALTQLPTNVYAVQTHVRVPRPPTPPPPVSLGEGSLLIEGETVCQVLGGQVVPVCHGDKPILTSGVLGKRVAHLIQLRDQAQAVLRVQLDGAPQAERQATRATLTQTYLAFVQTYGWINHVVVSEREDGTLVRRLPNLQTFKDDPDAMRVMALEVYNETDDTATPADIFTQDVVARDDPITQVESAQEALLVVLNTTGTVDVTAMADLYGEPEAVVLQELGDLVYHDPAAQQWVTADVYLSGHVKRKLAQAHAAMQQDPAYSRNVEALQAVQPPDVPPSEIEAHLGAPWIPRDLLQDFVCDTFAIGTWQATVAHNGSEALWNIEGERGTASAHATEAARVTYGTSRISGITLLQQALNLQFPTIYDPHPTDPNKRVKNDTETLVAREKQQQLKDQFQRWLWQTPRRTERCVRLYNDLRNTHRARQFNGEHLTFPGMTPLITLTAPQKAAVWRILTTGNTYLGHSTGSGKTFVMVAAGMKMHQTGLCRKPLYVVKNNTLEQFGRMALQLYPDAKFLIAGPDDFTRDRRKLLAARMASNHWDGIITTHSAFGHLQLSAPFQAEVLRDLIARYETLLVDHEREYGAEQKNIRKALEKQKSTYASRLHELLKTGIKDDGLLFDELGIDALFCDEAHAFRKLDTPTKMQRVAGVQGDGSGMAFDLYLKVQYLHTKTPGRNVVFASGTPVCNTLGELFGIQRMLTPDALAESGIAHFDAWAATFGVVTEKLELGPDGQTLRPRVRLGEFANLPELQQMLQQFMEVQSAAQLALPTPQLAGGAPEEVVTPLSPDGQVIQAQLVDRYGDVRQGRAARPGEALLIMGEGRKLGVDARLVSKHATAAPGGKLAVLADRVYAHWQEGLTDRTTQLIFCDVGVNPTPWGFSAYEDVIDSLVKRGLPAHEIARVDAAKSDMQRYRLFQQVQQGQVRVLLGSTEKMGTGTNVQARLVALHHVDVPLLPNEIDQRNGRILRQGNLHRDWGKPVHIYYYGTGQCVEAVFWQILQAKAHFIHQFLTGASTVRKAEDIGEQELSFAQMKAIVSGNPALQTLAETEAELRRLALLDKHDRDQRFLAQRRLKTLPDDLARQQGYLTLLQADQRGFAAWNAVQGPRSVTEQVLTLDDQVAPSATVPLSEGEARRLLDPILLPYVDVKLSQTVRLGTYKGFPWGVSTTSFAGTDIWLEGQATRRVSLGRRQRPGIAALHALRELEHDTPVRVAQAQHQVERLTQEGRMAEAQLAATSPLVDYRQQLQGLRDELEVALSAQGDASLQAGIVHEIEKLRGAHRSSVGSTPARSAPVAVPMAEAITTRILREQAEEDTAAQAPAA